MSVDPGSSEKFSGSSTVHAPAEFDLCRADVDCVAHSSLSHDAGLYSAARHDDTADAMGDRLSGSPIATLAITPGRRDHTVLVGWQYGGPLV
jgi:hypothetical protein